MAKHLREMIETMRASYLGMIQADPRIIEDLLARDPVTPQSEWTDEEAAHVAARQQVVQTWEQAFSSPSSKKEGKR